MAETPSDSLSPTVSREAFVAELRRLLPEDALIHDEAELRAYECDGLSAFRELPWAVALPRSEDVAGWFGSRVVVLPPVMRASAMTWLAAATALFASVMALLTRMMRASMLEVVGQDYIRVARAKGLSTVQILWRHQLRNAILPVVTVLGPVTAAILSGTFIIETIYAIPGMGKYYVNGIQNLDYSQILGMTIFYGTFLILANFVVDIIYGFIDPRIRVDRRDARS